MRLVPDIPSLAEPVLARLENRADLADRLAAQGIADWALAEARAFAPRAARAAALLLVDEILASPGRGLAALLPLDRRARIGALARWLIDDAPVGPRH